jgi:hypothetical protein
MGRDGLVRMDVEKSAYHARGNTTRDAMFIGKFGKILRALNSNMNTTALFFGPWTLESMMPAERITVPNFVTTTKPDGVLPGERLRLLSGGKSYSYHTP